MFRLILAEVESIRTRSRARETELARSLGIGRAASELLRQTGPAGGTIPELARGLALSRQSVQRVADGLVEAGLAAYQPNPHHRRSPRLVLTPEGGDRRRALERGRAELEPDLSDDLEDEELETALQVLRTIRALL